MSQQIDACLAKLNKSQYEVLIRRYGLQGFDPMTLEDVGTTIGLTRERVRQIQIEGLKKMHRILAIDGLSLELLLK